MLILKDFNHRINKHVGNGSISDKMLKIFQLNFNDQDFRMASLEKAISTDKEIERITGLAEMLRQKESANVKSSGK